MTEFDEEKYLDDVRAAGTSLGITASWMKGFVENEFPGTQDILNIMRQIETKMSEFQKTQDAGKKVLISNELKKIMDEGERLRRKAIETSKAMDRDWAICALNDQQLWE